AASAGEGLEAFERERPDVIVSDLAMPETDGFELIRRIRALPSDRGGACRPSLSRRMPAPRTASDRCPPASRPT
ncbi:MAG: hypothetical protein DMG01_08555, partial [Acidobacteria bacterium]